MKSLLNKLFYLVDFLVPKKNRISFSSFPDLADNPFALFNYMLSDKRLEVYSFVWLTEGKATNYLEFKNNKRIIIVNKRSLKGLYLYFSSKVVFYSHGLFGNISSYNDKKRINMWHGMPFKKVGALDENFKGTIPTQDKLIVTSKMCSEIYSKAFKIPKKNIIDIGQSRNDLLFTKTNYFKKKSIELSNYDKIIAWLPTYRKSNIGDIREDGNSEKGKIGFLGIKSLNILDTFLVEKKILIVLKLHPMDVLNNEKFDVFNNIIFIKNKDLEAQNEQLYPILGLTDALITDYSSVFIDYLLLDRPIGFAMDDFNEYKSNRGFLFDEPEKMLKGEFINNYNDLLTFLNDVLGEYDKYKDERTEIKKTYHRYCDSNSSERITDWMLTDLI